jgi:hypothetical protein
MKSTQNMHGEKSEKGQVLVIIALTFTALIMIIGLAVDTGYFYVSYSRLRRAVDAAALAATGEFKRNFQPAQMEASARQELKLNGILITPNADNPDVVVRIESCITNPTDAVLCPAAGETAKKLVRVRVTQDVPLFFLAVMGIRRVPMTIETISQAASLDVVLLLQNSESMAFDTGNPDPSVCNPLNACEPFETVKAAAKDFTNTLYFPYDRIAVITYNQLANLDLPLSDQSSGPNVNTVIDNLKLFVPAECPYTSEAVQALLDPIGAPPNPPSPAAPWYPGGDPKSPCRKYTDAHVYSGRYDCPMFYATNADGTASSARDPSWCGSTNSAAGLAMAGNHFQGAYPTGSTIPVREDAVWVILLLGTGAPNIAHDDHSLPLCPASTRSRPSCRDLDVLTRHCWTNTAPCMQSTPYPVDATHSMSSTYNQTDYDAYDRAMDMVDVEVQNGISIFTIGLGFQNVSPAGDINNLPTGETFLKYAATKSGGIYRPTATASGLSAIFLEIANKIATKLTQ